MILVDGDTLQEVYGEDPWKVLVCCVLLNRTSRQQVDCIRDELFERWPTPGAMARADTRELSILLHSLGFYNRRARTLVEMSKKWLETDPLVDGVGHLPGVGKYASDSWAIFVQRRTDVEPTDKVLIKTLCELDNMREKEHANQRKVTI